MRIMAFTDSIGGLCVLGHFWGTSLRFPKKSRSARAVAFELNDESHLYAIAVSSLKSSMNLFCSLHSYFLYVLLVINRLSLQSCDL